MIELPEPSAHMYPSDLERFQETETFAHAYSVKVGCPDETSTELYTADQLRTCIKKAAAEAREQMREECERLRAALEEFVSIVGTAAGFETAMTESDDVFTEFLNKQQARVDGALANANALLDAARANP